MSPSRLDACAFASAAHREIPVASRWEGRRIRRVGKFQSRSAGKVVEYAATCAATEWRVAHFAQKDLRMWHGSPALLRVFFSRCMHRQETPGRCVVRPGVSTSTVAGNHIRGTFCAFSGFDASWSLCSSRNSYAFQDEPRALYVARLARYADSPRTTRHPPRALRGACFVHYAAFSSRSMACS